MGGGDAPKNVRIYFFIEGELFVSKDDPRVAEPSSCDMRKTSDMIFAEEVACQPAARIEGGSGSEKGGEDELNVGMRELRVAGLSSADETSLSEEKNVLTPTPPTTHTNAQSQLQSMTTRIENSCCYPSNTDLPNRPVGGELRYPCTLVQGGTTLHNMEPSSGLKKHMTVSSDHHHTPHTHHPETLPNILVKTQPPPVLAHYPPQTLPYRTMSMVTLWEEGVMGDWLENFVMCEELVCEIVNELRQDQEQVPPVAASEVLTPEKETPESRFGNLSQDFLPAHLVNMEESNLPPQLVNLEDSNLPPQLVNLEDFNLPPQLVNNDAYVLEEKEKKNGLVFKKIENEIVRGG